MYVDIWVEGAGQGGGGRERERERGVEGTKGAKEREREPTMLHRESIHPTSSYHSSPTHH